MREGVAAVDGVVSVGIEGFTGGMDGQGVDVVAEDFCAEVLLCGQPGHAGQMFEGQAVLDPFEGLLDSPPGVIKRAEVGGGVGRHVEERGDENADLVAEDLADESNFARRSGRFVIDRVLLAGSGQRYDLLGQTRSTEGMNGTEIEAIGAHAEMAFSLYQGGEEPAGRVPAVEHQDVIVAEFVEVFEEHLTLADVGRIEFRR